MKNTALSPLFLIFSVFFCTCLILSNFLASKLFVVCGIALPSAVIIFPVTYIINDCIAEVWGFRRSRFLIWLGFLMNFFVALIGMVAVWLPGAPFWNGSEHFDYFFMLAPRIACASFLAFLVGSFLNAYVMSRMKVLTGGKGFSARAILSTVVGEFADSCIFLTLAFAGSMPITEIFSMVMAQVTVKTLYEVFALPLTSAIVGKVKAIEGVDTMDTEISYNIFRVRELG